MEGTVKISNGIIDATIQTFGAELTELSRIGGENVLWNKDGVHWNRVAPNLFPIVGRLKNDSYTVDGKQYTMTQHGFARDHQFEIESQTKNAVTLLLRSSEKTMEMYPFSFEFRVIYSLKNTDLNIQYSVKNTDVRDMPYSVGGHPGFALNEDLSHYELHFPGSIQIERHLLEGSHFSGQTETMIIKEILPLSNNLFERDAIVFIAPPFKELVLAHKEKGSMLKVSSDQWDALGIWTKKGAPFLCIEPWWGYADRADSSGDLYEKAGIHVIKPLQEEYSVYSISL